MKELCYLASPYSNKDPDVREARYHAACRATVGMIRRGLLVFSPVVHSHILASVYDCGSDWKFWREVDLALLRACNAVYVLRIDGWDRSEGLKAELSEAMRLGLTVGYVDGEGNLVDE